jgi:exodeoxyribonuclease VII large subunit
MPTFLEVQFKDKDQAKALGARWDGAAKKWYVPDGKELTPFNAWLPVALRGATQPSVTSSALTPAVESETDVEPAKKGMTLFATAGGCSPSGGSGFQIWRLDHG